MSTTANYEEPESAELGVRYAKALAESLTQYERCARYAKALADSLAPDLSTEVIQPAPQPYRPLISRAVYMRRAWTAIDEIKREASSQLAGVDFDTIVVRGLSGQVVGLQLSQYLDKYLCIVRKKTEISHSRNPLEGTLGRRWIFLDDFISTGETFQNVLRHVTDEANSHGHETEFVGGFFYARCLPTGDEGCEFMDAQLTRVYGRLLNP